MDRNGPELQRHQEIKHKLTTKWKYGPKNGPKLIKKWPKVCKNWHFQEKMAKIDKSSKKCKNWQMICEK